MKLLFQISILLHGMKLLQFLNSFPVYTSKFQIIYISVFIFYRPTLNLNPITCAIIDKDLWKFELTSDWEACSLHNVNFSLDLCDDIFSYIKVDSRDIQWESTLKLQKRKQIGE